VVGHALASNNLDTMWTDAAASMYTGHFAEADRVLAQIKRKAPLSPWVRVQQSAMRQLRGNYGPDTWAVYQMVRHLPNAAESGLRPRTPFKQPRWDGSPLGPDQMLLVWADAGGLGDRLQWSRMLPAVKARLGQGRLRVRWPQGTGKLLL
jgi:hypothetical protein